jgi:hypothetical protein
MMIPSWVYNSLHPISARLPKLLSLPRCSGFLPMFSHAIRKASLHKIARGDFVRVRTLPFAVGNFKDQETIQANSSTQFQLIPIGIQCCPRWFRLREFPPEAEVMARRYLYEPVPMEDVELYDIPLPHLLKQGPHTDKFWITTFPKRLREPLVRGDDGQRVIGWGIRINESLNWAVILLSILLILLAIGVVVIVYTVITSDNSSAFGLGAFIVTLFTVYLTYQYFTWKEDM